MIIRIAFIDLNVRTFKTDALMDTIDSLNRKFGHKAIIYGSENTKQPWLMKREYLSPEYTT